MGKPKKKGKKGKQRNRKDGQGDLLNVSASVEQSGNTPKITDSRAKGKQCKGDESILVTETRKTSFELGDANLELANQCDALNSSEDKNGIAVASRCYMKLASCEDNACLMESSLVGIHARIIYLFVSCATIASHNMIKKLGIDQGTTDFESANEIVRNIDTIRIKEGGEVKILSGNKRYQTALEDIRMRVGLLIRFVLHIDLNLCQATEEYSLNRCVHRALLEFIWHQLQMRLSGCLEEISKIKQFLRTSSYLWKLKADNESLIELLEELERSISCLFSDSGKKCSEILQVQTSKDMLKIEFEELLIMYRDPESEVGSTNQDVSALDDLLKATDYLEKTSPVNVRSLDDEILEGLNVLADASKNVELTPKNIDDSKVESEQTLEGLADVSREKQADDKIIDELKSGREQTLKGLVDTSRKEQTDDKIIEELEREVEQVKAQNLKLQSEIDDIDVELAKANVKLGYLNEALEHKKSRELDTLGRLSVLEKELQDSEMEVEQEVKKFANLQNVLNQERKKVGRLGEISIQLLLEINTTRFEYVSTMQRSEHEDDERSLKAEIQLMSDNEFQENLDSVLEANFEPSKEAAARRAENNRCKLDAEKSKEELIVERGRNQSGSLEISRKVFCEENRLEQIHTDVDYWIISQADVLCEIYSIFDEGCHYISRHLSGCTKLVRLHHEKEDLKHKCDEIIAEMLSLETIALIFQEKLQSLDAQVDDNNKEENCLQTVVESVVGDEEKREALRQLCVVIDRHFFARCNQLCDRLSPSLSK